MSKLAKPGEPAALGIRPKFATALTDPLRVRILMEIDAQPISPSRFVERAGGDLRDVSRCFRQLQRWGYAELIDVRRGRRQGAAIEHVYRGRQPVDLGYAGWARLPLSRREQRSVSVLAPFVAQASAAMEAGALDDELDRHVSWDEVVLDRVARAELSERIEAAFASFRRRQDEAGDRQSGEPIRTTVHLAAFRSTRSPELLLRTPERRHPPAGPSPDDAPLVIRPESAMALSNRWRSRILLETSSRPISPAEFVEEFGGEASYVARCFRELASWGFIEVVEHHRGSRQGAGGERLYRSLQRGYIGTPTWERLPRFLRSEISHAHLSSYLEQVSSALGAGAL
jgi:hypothetical protein